MKKNIKKSMDVKAAKVTKGAIRWEAPDFVYYKKSTNWYIIISVIAIILIVIFFFMKIYAGIVVVAAAVLALFSNAKVKPENIEYTISDSGINFKKKKYIFDNLKSFCISGEAGFLRLILEQTGKFKPHLVIILHKINPVVVRNFLLRKLPENPKLAQFLHDRMSDLFGF